MHNTSESQSGAHDVPEGSKQLQPGDKFHYHAPNGITYFRLEMVEKNDGSQFPMMSTAPACAALPVELDSSGDVIAVHLLEQAGRPEMGGDSVALKAVGAFCNVGESSHAAAIRCLDTRLGIQVDEKSLIHIGHANGFGDQYRFPIDLFILTTYEKKEEIPTEGCTRVRMTLKALAVAERDRKFFNDETIDLIAYILLRNQFRDEYSW
jgi:ADP-ribose pyrophosphatase YjhB (NUDIX family)